MRKLRAQTLANMKATRLANDSPPETATVPVAISSLASLLDDSSNDVVITSSDVYAAFISISTPRLVTHELDAWQQFGASVEATDLAQQGVEGRMACLAAVLLAPACCESLFLSLMSTNEAVPDPAQQNELLHSVNDLSRSPAAPGEPWPKDAGYCPGLLGTEDGECFAREVEKQHLAGAEDQSHKAFANIMRVYLEHNAWGAAAAANAFAHALAGDTAGLKESVVATEDARKLVATPQKPPLPIERRRYQGTERYLSVAERLATVDWPGILQLQEWKDVKGALLAKAGGHGMGSFLGDKGVVALLLSGVLPRIKDGGDFGPGAILALVSLSSLAKGDGWRSVYKRTPSEERAEALADINLPQFIRLVRRAFRSVVRFYWHSREQSSVVASATGPLLMAALDRNHPTIFFENACCELLNRRAATLAWVARRLAKLPKGRMNVRRLFESFSHRTFANMRLLIMRDGFVVAVTIRDLLDLLPMSS